MYCPNRDKPKSFSDGNIKWVTTPNLMAESIKLNCDSISLRALLKQRQKNITQE